MSRANSKNALSLTLLDNGVRVLTHTLPYAESVTIAVWVEAGSAHETETIHGVSHFVEHLLFAGTPLYPSKRHLAQAVESAGGILNAFGEREGTCYWARTVAEHLPTAVHILGEMLCHSLFRAKDVESERLSILQELNKHRDSPAGWVYTLISGALWPNQAVGRYIGGSEKTVRRLTRREILEYYRHYYRSHNVVVAVVGNISGEHAAREIEKCFADLPAEMPDHPKVGPIAPRVPAVNSPCYSFETRDSYQLHICLGTQAPSRDHSDRYAFEMINVIMGKGMGSRLLDRIRTREGFAYSVHTALSTFRFGGAFTIYTGVSPEHGTAAIEAIFREMEILTCDGVTEEELVYAKEFYKGRVRLGAENLKNYACLLGDNLLHGQVRGIPDILADVDKVTLERTYAPLDTYLQPDNFCIAAIGPLHAINELTAYFGSGSPP